MIFRLERVVVRLRAKLAAQATRLADAFLPASPAITRRTPIRRVRQRRRLSPDAEAAIFRLFDRYYNGEISYAERTARIRALPGGRAWLRGDPDVELAVMLENAECERTPNGRLMTFDEILDGVRLRAAQRASA